MTLNKITWDRIRISIKKKNEKVIVNFDDNGNVKDVFPIGTWLKHAALTKGVGNYNINKYEEGDYFEVLD